MRTVTFSQPEIRNILNQNFVCYHTSTEGDPTAGESIRHRPTDPAGTCIRGNGPQNLQTLFLTPDGKIFHAVSGYASPEDFYRELEFAYQLFESMKGNRSASVTPESIVVDGHRTRLRNLGFGDDEIAARGVLGGMSIPMPGNLSQNGSGQSSNLQGAPTGVFDAMIRRQVLTDHKFCMDHPLMSHDQFERDPTPLVGNGKSFFMSSSSGN